MTCMNTIVCSDAFTLDATLATFRDETGMLWGITRCDFDHAEHITLSTHNDRVQSWRDEGDYAVCSVFTGWGGSFNRSGV